MKRVISLWLPRLATDRLANQALLNNQPAQPSRDWRDKAGATVAQAEGGQRIEAVNDLAQAAGIHPGMKLHDARALKPDLLTQAADAAADRRLLERLADWCDRYTPWVALDQADAQVGTGGAGLLLDISGCAHLFGDGRNDHEVGERRLLADLVKRLTDLGFACRAALADSEGAAWAVARFADRSGALIVPPAGQRQALSGLPVASLRLDPVLVEGLHRLGLRRVGDLYSLPRPPLTNRFGPGPVLRLDQALGLVRESLAPRRPPPPFRARLSFAEPIGRPEDIEAACARLLSALCRQLEGAGMGARRLQLVGFRVDGSLVRAAIGTSRPNRDPAHLARLYAQALEQIDPGFGIELMMLAALTVEKFDTSQSVLEATNGVSANSDPDSVGELLDRLSVRLGEKNVLRPLPRFSHLPERAMRARPANEASKAPARQTARQTDWRAFAALKRARPVQLLSMPEPIDVTAPIPDDPPLQFRWRQAMHRVAKAEGPERLANEWWREEGPASELARAIPRVRDYYRIEDEAGRRFWIYRDGPLNALSEFTPARTARWYLHGFCA